jgi:hypothetical protein
MEPIYRNAMWRTGARAAAVAVAVNAAIFTTGRTAGVDFVTASATERSSVSLSHVVASTALAVLVGTAAAVCLGSRRRIRVLERIAVAAALLSLGGPLAMGSGAPTKATLALMHLVVATALVLTLKRGAPRSTIDETSRQRHPERDGIPGLIRIYSTR